MVLSACTKLGPYEVVEPLGAGGMGEVYRARDLRLNREVAVKILPESVASDADRLHRFELEARAIGALNHPNVLAVHDVGSCNGIPYIITELLEGETLRDRLRSGPVPVRKAIDYAIQIGCGLSTAHEKGIIHRDLKPENIFLTRDGRLKILDFGLAKLKESNQRDSRSEEATRTVNTSEGVVIGTVGYMSPEQVRGMPIDGRSDLFAFGAILYEMISGKRAFQGDSAADTMTAILTRNPPELAEHNHNVTPVLDHIVGHCLEKNREERFQSAHDVVFNLQLLTSTASSTKVAQTPLAPVRLRKKIPLAIIIGAIALAAMFLLGRAAAPRPAMAPYKPLTFREGTVSNARYAPDGRTVVYSAVWDGSRRELFSVRADVPASQPLGIFDADIASVSRTGEMALIMNRRSAFGANWVNAVSQLTPLVLGTLARAPLNGGSPRPILDNVLDADWDHDGHDLAVTHVVNEQFRLEYPIGKSLYEEGGQGYISHPRFSPKGDKIAFLHHPVEGDDKGEVVIVDLAGKSKVLSAGWASIRGLSWSPLGDEIWFTASDVGFADAAFAVDLSGRKRILARLLPDLTLQDVTFDGHALLVHSDLKGHVFVHGPGTQNERELRSLELSSATSLSQNGEYLLSGGFSTTEYGVFLRKTDGSPPVRLGDGIPEALSPDGKWASGRTVTSPVQLVLLPIGAGLPRQLTNDRIDHHDSVFLSADEIMFGGYEEGHRRIFVQSLSAGAQPHAVGPEGLESPIPSHDAKRLAAHLKERIVTCPLPDCPSPQIVPGVGTLDSILNWTADNKHLLIGQFGVPYRILRVDPSTGRKEQIKELVPPDAAGLQGISAVITPDGKYYAYGVAQVLSTLYEVDRLQ